MHILGVKHKLQSRLVKKLIFMFSRIVKTLATHVDACNHACIHFSLSNVCKYTYMHACIYIYMRRPHRPRDPEVRQVYKYAGIHLPGLALKNGMRKCTHSHARSCMHAGDKAESSDSDGFDSSSETESESDEESEAVLAPNCLFFLYKKHRTHDMHEEPVAEEHAQTKEQATSPAASSGFHIFYMHVQGKHAYRQHACR